VRAEALGCMSALHDATLSYLTTCVQFSVPIGKFQVLRHRMVDMLHRAALSAELVYDNERVKDTGRP
jgi:alkylation response protein AidB-like acyl-CoA dehydrogenase